ncbi:hypothetical protein BH23ACT6_BH23ACT6_06440 [soil metagenome]
MIENSDSDGSASPDSHGAPGSKSQPQSSSQPSPQSSPSSERPPQSPPPDSSPLQPSPSQSRRIIVSIDVQHLQHITEVRDGLVSRGVVIEHVMAELGMITATVPDDAHVAAAQQVDGVESVEQDRSYRVPPPDAPVQ